jgi:crotonobetainyl-CoA:carnitine CoA-transferase CaiB-like acyl-CoA transferase
MEKLGLGYEEMRKVKPDIIYAALSGFGLDGPYKDRPSFAPLAEAMSGWMRLTGDIIDPQGPPIRPAEYHGDLDPALWAVIAILSAIRHRDKTGEGQVLDVAQLDCMVLHLGVPISNYFATSKLPWEIWRDRPTSAILFGIFKASDGYVYIAAEAAQTDRLKRAVGRDLESQEELEAWTSGQTVKHIIDTLVSADVPVAPIYQLDAMVDDPQVRARDMIMEINHPKAGKMRQPNFPLKFSAVTTLLKPAPILGQHNDEILKDLLGYGAEEITVLRQEGVIS